MMPPPPPYSSFLFLPHYDADCWVITTYMGQVVNLRESWDRYKAARAALSNTTNISNVTSVTKRKVKELTECHKMLARYLTEGVLVESFVLDSIQKLLNCLRRCVIKHHCTAAIEC